LKTPISGGITYKYQQYSLVRPQAIRTECKAREDGKQSAETGCLTTGYCKGKWMVLSSKFDIAISTENSKIKDKQ